MIASLRGVPRRFLVVRWRGPRASPGSGACVAGGEEGGRRGRDTHQAHLYHLSARDWPCAHSGCGGTLVSVSMAGSRETAPRKAMAPSEAEDTPVAPAVQEETRRDRRV